MLATPDIPYASYDKELNLTTDIKKILNDFENLLKADSDLRNYVNKVCGAQAEKLNDLQLPMVCSIADQILRYGGNPNQIGQLNKLKDKIWELRENVLNHTNLILAEDSDRSAELSSVTPKMGIDINLAETLRLAYKTSLRAKEYIGILSPEKRNDKFSGNKRETSLLAQILLEHALFKDNDGSMEQNQERLIRYLAPMSLKEALSFRSLLDKLSGKTSKYATSFRDLVVAKVDTYDGYCANLTSAIREGKANNFFFNWFFFNQDSSDFGFLGYSDHVYFDPHNALTAADHIVQSLESLDKNNGYTNKIHCAIKRWKSSAAYTALEKKLRTGIHTATDDPFTRRKGIIRDDFEDFMRIDRMYDANQGIQIRQKARKEGDYLSQIQNEVTSADPGAVYGYRNALFDYEYLLIWRKFFDAIEGKTDLCIPDIRRENKDLLIEQGKNLALVVNADNPAEVVPNPIYFTSKKPNLCISGANGGGKTHLLEMITNMTLMAHRGLYTFAKQMFSPTIGFLEHGVNTTIHKQTSSAFQNWIHYMLKVCKEIENNPFRQNKGIVLLDEPGRGTDSKDAIPIIIGLMKYFQDRGIFFGFSTHFNEIAKCNAILEKLGLSCGFHTMNRKTHKLIEAIGRSHGIEVAREFGWDEEIMQTTEAVLHESESDIIHIPKKTAKPKSKHNEKINILGGANGLEEMGIIKETKNESWGRYTQVGEAARLFAMHSPLPYTDWISGDEKDAHYGTLLPGMRPDAAEVFSKLLTQELSNQEYEERKQTFLNLKSCIKSSNEPEIDTLHVIVDSLKDFNILFSLHTKKPSKDEDRARDLLISALAGKNPKQKQDDLRAFQDAVHNCSVTSAIKTLREFVKRYSENEYPAMKKQIKEVQGFVKSDGCKKLENFWDGIKNAEKISMQDWDLWVNLCHEYYDIILELQKRYLEIHFFGVVGKTIEAEKFCEVQDNDEPDIHLKQVRSSGLLARSKYLQKQESKHTWGRPNITKDYLFEVVPSDINMSFEKPTIIISGTNGGGKTQILSTLASIFYLRRQIGFVPSEEARIPRLNFIGFSISTAEHTETLSSWQNEVKKIKDIIDNYKKLGEPSRGVIFLDEPGKGTSSEDAVPLLIGLIKYFESRGVMVIFTTHFSGIYDYLNRLEDSAKVQYQPLRMNFFSEDQKDRYVIQEGIGASEGIRVAENMGIPAEIIQTARFVYNELESGI